MTSDTLWQKYIYNTPFDDEEMPLLNSRLSLIDEAEKTISISGLDLYSLDEKDFNSFCNLLHLCGYENIIIKNDYQLKSENALLKKGLKAYLLSFCFLFQKHGFHCAVQNKNRVIA